MVGPDVVRAAAELGAPVTVSTLEPMPRMSAPIFDEHPREVLDVRLAGGVADDASSPGVSAAAISAFSVAMTDGSSMKTSPARSPPGGAR